MSKFNQRLKNRQFRILTRIRSPYGTVRRDDWKVRVEGNKGERIFFYRTTDDRRGELVFKIGKDWHCELIEVSGFFERKKEQVEKIIVELNQEFARRGKKNGASKDH